MACSEAKKKCISRTTRYRIRREMGQFSSFNSDAELTDYRDHEVHPTVDHQCTSQCSTFEFEYGETIDREMHDSIYNDNNIVNSAAVNFFEERERDFDTPWTKSICNEGDVYVNTDDNSDISDENCEVGSEITGYETATTTSSSPALYQDSAISTSASNVLIMEYSIKHNLTNDALADLLKLLRVHLPSPNNCTASAHLFKKLFAKFSSDHTTHYFCNSCSTEIESACTVCPNSNCEAATISNFTRSSFIEVPIEQQIKRVLEST